MGKLSGFWNSNEQSAPNGQNERSEQGQDSADSHAPVHQDSHNDNRRPTSRDAEPNENSPLLQNEQHGRHHLHPDDPAVTPMNLWTVRIMRILTIIFLEITCVWFIVLIISSFVTPPGLNSRGSGFFEIAFTLLSFGLLTLLLVSFTTPSIAERIVMAVNALLLLVCMILIVSVKQLREEEGWHGILSAVWALLMSLWAVATDRVVEWGKKEEEERLTESRRSLREWCSVLSTTVLLVVYLIITILFTATLSLRASDANLKPEGHRYYVDSGKYEVHLFCTPHHGNATREKVTVLVEGEDPVAGYLGRWVQSAYEDGQIARYCYWDRPGFGWSDNAPSPLSAGMASDALREALVHAEEDGPYVLLSHGIGSIYSRIFASRQGSAVKGMLLIDPLHEDYLPKVASARRGLELWLRGFVSPLGIDLIFAGIFSGRSKADRVYGRSAWRNAKAIKAKFQESLSANSFTKTELNSARAILPKDIPLVVVSSGRMVKKSKEWDEAQRDLTMITDNLWSWDVVDKAPHNVWEKPEGADMIGHRISGLIDRAVKKMETEKQET